MDVISILIKWYVLKKKKIKFLCCFKNGTTFALWGTIAYGLFNTLYSPICDLRSNRHYKTSRL